MADRNLDLPWNVCRTEIYSGTSLRARLAGEGRLEGDWRSWGYRMRDERAEVMFRIIRVSLHERALAIDSLLNRLIGLSFARQIHDTLFPGDVTRDLHRAVTEVGIEARRDTVRQLRQMLALVKSCEFRDAQAIRRFAVEQGLAIGADDMPRRRRVASLWEHYAARGAWLSGRAGRTASRARAGFEVAAGS